MRSHRHPNLYRSPKSPFWQFRKYSKTKRAQFAVSTGIPAKDAEAALAYKLGMEKFNAWLGHHLPAGREILIRDIARALKVAKESRRRRTLSSFTNQVDNHVVPAFGHLRPVEMTSTLWETYDAKERKRGHRTRLFNTRKALREILIRARDEGMIPRVPALKNFDPPADPPRHLSHGVYARVRRALPMPVKLLAFLVYHQGPRPGEAMRYAFPMIDWHGEPRINVPGEITKTGRARTILLNSRVARFLRRYRKRASSPWLIPSRLTDKPLTAYNAVWDRAMDSLGLDYTMYNLRDTFITNRLERGLSSTFIGKYCDTSAKMIDTKYAVPIDTAMRRVAG